MLGFENHLNVLHEDKHGLPEKLAYGLAAFLNTTAVDENFRRFNGHTQVNATDLRAYEISRPEDANRSWIMGALSGLPDAKHDGRSIEKAGRMKSSEHINNAHKILVSLGLPRAQQNERSALCLLALLNITPKKKWAEAENPLMGITPIMNWIRNNYEKDYAPNTRETFRRQTMHQFVDAGVALYNPDKPDRSVNSPGAVYQIAPATLTLLRTFATRHWHANLTAYLAGQQTLAASYAKERKHNLVPVQIAPGKKIKLKPR